MGRRLVRKLLARKDLVTVLSRDPVGARRALPEGVRVAGYTPTQEGPWSDELASTDGVVMLAGEPIVGVRWSEAKKKEFEASRITAGEKLVEGIERLPPNRRPKVLVGASGCGFYGHRGSERWEEALARATTLGVRVVHTRFGIIFGKGGGALEKLARPFRMHVGGPIGSGKQIVPWVHIEDVCGIIMLAIDNAEAKGPINATAPNPVSMEQLAEAIGVILHRRSYLRVPEGALRALFGEGAEPLLTGQRALPRAAERLGYDFEYPEILPALESVLGPD